MNRAASVRPQAEAETLETREWYESRRPGLGAEFRQALDAAIARIAENPLMFQRVRGETRRAILDRSESKGGLRGHVSASAFEWRSGEAATRWRASPAAT